MAGGLAEEACAMFDRAAFFVSGSEIEPPDPGKGDGGGAHGARFQSDIKIAVWKPLRSEYGTGRPDHLNFRMRSRVVVFKGSVAVARQALRRLLTRTAPTGTSPRCAAFSASSRARSMKDPLVRLKLFCAHGHLERRIPRKIWRLHSPNSGRRQPPVCSQACSL